VSLVHVVLLSALPTDLPSLIHLALKTVSERRASLSEVVGEVIHDLIRQILSEVRGLLNWTKGCY
jgi:hypothetical protein